METQRLLVLGFLLRGEARIMKEHKTVRNIAFAMGFYVLWANGVGLLLPADQYAAMSKTVGFTSLFFLPAILIAAISETGINRGAIEKTKETKER